MFDKNDKNEYENQKILNHLKSKVHILRYYIRVYKNDTINRRPCLSKERTEDKKTLDILEESRFRS